MKAHHIMTRRVITIGHDATLTEAAELMLANHISGLPVVDAKGMLAGIITERDFLRRRELHTQKRRPRWIEFLRGASREAQEYVKTSGRKVSEIMTPAPYTSTEDTTLVDIVELMEQHQIKRVPIMRGPKIVGVISRQNFMQAVASLAREVPSPTVDDGHLRERILRLVDQRGWAPMGVNAIVKNGVVDLCGVITNEHVRQALVVGVENIAGVKEVHDHLAWVDPMSGVFLLSAEDEEAQSSGATAS